MTDHTPTIKQINNVGEDMVWEASVAADLIHTADTINISGQSGLKALDKVFIVSAMNTTDGTSIESNISYDSTNRLFTVAGDDNSSDAIRITYRRCSV